jgi:hypothetical protein
MLLSFKQRAILSAACSTGSAAVLAAAMWWVA